MSQYELVFNGKLIEGFDLNQVKENVGKLFKASPAQVEQMFSGKAVVLRNRLDDATARKYRAILQKNGAACVIREMGAGTARPQSQPAQAPAAPETPAKPAQASAIPSANATSAAVPTAKPVETLTGLPVAGEKVDDILSDVHWDVAPVGSRMEEEQDDLPLPEPDLSHLSVAPVGSDMGEKKKEAPPAPPDTSHLKLDS